MNIFYLSHDPQKAAHYHHYNHANKMLMEAAQMLCTAHRICDGEMVIDTSGPRKRTLFVHPDAHVDQTLYLAAHRNHPCNIWIRQSADNYMWLFQLYDALGQRFMENRHKHHACYGELKGDIRGEQMRKILSNVPNNVGMSGFTPPPAAMDDCYKSDDDIVTQYRRLYINDKLFSYWEHGDIPEWIPPEVMYSSLLQDCPKCMAEPVDIGEL